MEKKFVKVGQLREGSYILIDDLVCQIKGIEKSKPGKHGAAKVNVVAISLFDGSKHSLMKPSGSIHSACSGVTLNLVLAISEAFKISLIISSSFRALSYRPSTKIACLSFGNLSKLPSFIIEATPLMTEIGVLSWCEARLRNSVLA